MRGKNTTLGKQFLWHLCDTQQSFKSLSKAWIRNRYFFENKSVLRKSCCKIAEHYSSLVLFPLEMNPHIYIISILTCLFQNLTLFIISFHIPVFHLLLLPGPSFCFPTWRRKLVGPDGTPITNLVLAFLWDNLLTVGVPFLFQHSFNFL